MSKWFELLSVLAQEYICGDEANQVDRAWHCIDQALTELAKHEVQQVWISRTGRAEHLQLEELAAAFHLAKRGILFSMIMETAHAHREVGWVKFLWEGDQFGAFASWIMEGGISLVD